NPVSGIGPLCHRQRATTADIALIGPRPLRPRRGLLRWAQRAASWANSVLWRLRRPASSAISTPWPTYLILLTSQPFPAFMRGGGSSSPITPLLSVRPGVAHFGDDGSARTRAP